MNAINLFTIIILMCFSVDADLVGWNRLSGSVSRSKKVVSMVKSGGIASPLDQYIKHFGKTRSHKALKELIKLKRMENKLYNDSKHTLFW